MPVMHALAWAETVGWMLAHSLWQGAVIALVLGAVLRVLPRAAARARYAVACVSLALMVVLPTMTGLRVVQPRPATTTAVPTASMPVVDVALARDPAREAIVMSAPYRLLPTRIRLAVARGDAAVPIRGALRFATLAWLLGVAVMLTRLVGGAALNRQLTRPDVIAAPAEWLTLLIRLRSAMGIAHPVCLRVSARVTAPLVIGWIRPLVLMPTSALMGLSPWQVELLLRHELAHVRRHDYLVNLLQCVAEVLLFYHPAAWWVSRHIRAEREHCCDDAVVSAAGVTAYVGALVAMEEQRGPLARCASALALSADGASLLQRVQRLAGEPATASPRWTSTHSASLVGVMVGVPLLLLLFNAPRGMAGETTAGIQGADPSRPVATVGFAAGQASSQPMAAACDVETAGTTSTLCAPLTALVADVLQQRGREGVVVVQHVGTGAVVSSASPAVAGTSSITRASMPASLWKLSLAAIWWEQGMGERMVSCADRIDLGSREIRHWRKMASESTMDAADMLVESCNTAAAHMALELRDRLGLDGMRAAFSRLGFPEPDPSDVSVPAGAGRNSDVVAREETFWATASAEWRRRMSPAQARVRLPAHEDDGAWGALALGQAVEVTPLHVARLLQAIGNDGRMLRPTVERAFAIQRDTGQRIMRTGTARRLRDAMRAVVRDGTARTVAPVLRGARWSLGGKTGSVGAPDGARADGYFAGLLFDERLTPQYAVVVYLRGSGRGGGEAADVAAQITRRLGGFR